MLCIEEVFLYINTSLPSPAPPQFHDSSRKKYPEAIRWENLYAMVKGWARSQARSILVQ